MLIPVFIDSCAWNWLFDRQSDLGEALPNEKYALFVTREVEIEILSIKPVGKDGNDKRSLKSYIESCIKTHDVRTSYIFGFAEAGSLVYGGFGQGTWQSDQDRGWYDRREVKDLLQGKAPRNVVLTDNQADASLAVRSFDSVVVTGEPKSKKGPLRLASQQGGQIVFLPDVDQSGLSLKDYITRRFP
jgi:hypothetical protein